jgi:hypothetical protein
LLASFLKNTELREIYGDESSLALELPRVEEIPPMVFAEANTCWTDLAPWWNDLQIESLTETEMLHPEDSTLARIVELIACFLAHDLSRDSWRSLLGELPAPLRDIDAWLLLRVGANLPADADSVVADLLAEWLMTDRKWAYVRVSHLRGRWDLHLARAFVASIGPLLSEEQYQRFESWLAGYREVWTPEDEQLRWQYAKQTGRLIPNIIGATAYRLLPELGNRLSGRSRYLLGVLGRKLDDRLRELLDLGLVGGWVGSVIPDEVADRWSVQQWVECLTDPSLSMHGHPAKWHKLGPSTVGEYSLESLVSQLRRLSEKAPHRYLPLARALDATIAAEARTAVLSGITRPTLSDRLTVEHTWEPLDDSSVAEIVLMPAYLQEPMCSRQIAWIVAERPSYPWPELVVELLLRMAQVDTRTTFLEKRSSMGLTNYRWNEDACVALFALGNLARQHHDRQPQVLAVAAHLVDHEDPGRRASAAVAAMQCFDTDPDASASVLLAAADDPEVACERDVIWPLYRLAIDKPSGQSMRAAARERLLALSRDERERIAEWGGRAAVALRWHGLVADEELAVILSEGGPVRRGAARTVSDLLEHHEIPGWLRDLTVSLANDLDSKTGNTILMAFSGKAGDHLDTDHELLRALLDTEAFKIRPGPLIKGCDQQDRLLPIAERIVDTARAVAAGRAEHQPRRHRWHEDAELADLLPRLVEEAEREDELTIRTDALDAWDALIEAGVYSAWSALDDRLQS